MAAPRARYIVDLLTIHAEDLAFLWGQRRAALNSPRHRLREYAELNERIEAHLQGLLVAPAAELVALLQPQLTAPDRDDVFAAAYALLRLAEPASTHMVVIEFSRAAGPTLAGLRDALSLAAPTPFAAEMQSALEHAKPVTAAAAAVVLANHRLLDPAAPRLTRLLAEPDPQVAAWAWRAASAADAHAGEALPHRAYRQALAHDAAAVRDAGWHAVAWAGKSGALASLRQLAGSADVVALHWLAVLGDGSDTALIQKAALAIPDPVGRCALLARHGHPAALPLLVGWICGDDLALAAAAGEAYTRITGAEIRGERRSLPVAGDADDFTRAMAPLVWLPDAAKARQWLDQQGAHWAQATRWCAGVRLDGDLGARSIAQLDFEARWDVAARAALARRPVSVPAPIH